MKVKKLGFIAWLVILCVVLSSVYMPAFAEESSVYYTEQPSVNGSVISAKVMNKSADSVMFIAAAYSGAAIADAKIQKIPVGGETAVSVTMDKEYAQVKCYLWSENTIEPYGAPVAAAGKLPAFPGAEGGGMWTTGARGGEGMEVYHVYKLTDDGSYGTLRDAVSQPNRIVVFDVAGNIALEDTLTIKANNLTILGQTAPGQGICIKDCNTAIASDNVILRYLRFRMGDAKTMEQDTIGARNRKNIILDHCSISWSVDECASFYDNTDFTMQWCIISESLRHSVHSKDTHGYGGIWGGTNASFHHNLLAHHDSRNPRIQGGTYYGSDYDMSSQMMLADLRNNVIYNWGGNSAYGGQRAMPVNIINSYYKYGPATKVKNRVYELTSSESINGGQTTYFDWSTDLYLSGNYIDGDTAVTNDNSKGVNINNAKNYYIWNENNMTDEAKTIHFRYEKDYPVKTETAQDAYVSVLEGAGASIERDSVDAHVIEDVKNRTGKTITYKYTDDNGKEKTDTTYGIINTPSDVGGYPELTGTKSKDTDGDGMPNEWEDKNGLDKLDPADGTAFALSGYTNLEEYANALANKSYTRDPSYDPDAEDYDPSVNAPTPSPSPSDDPSFELVDSWTAKSGDEKAAAGTEFMRGLTGIIALTKTQPDGKTYSDGFTNNFAITSSSNAKLNADGTITGCALKYTAPESGRLTIYAYGVLAKTPPNIFYAIPEGAKDVTADNIFSEPIDEDGKKVLCKINVDAGKTYYFLIPGSKARFQGAKFERKK